MSSVSRRLGLWSLVFCLAAALIPSTARAQASSGSTTLGRVFSRIDVGIGGTGSFTGNTTGTNYLGQTVTNDTSSTVGALVTFRYTKSPWVGGEFNIGYARYTNNFTLSANGPAPASTLPVQSNAIEYTLGYVAHPPHPLIGLQPYLGGGYGLLYFHPTSGGGEGLPGQRAGAGYYTVGLEKAVVPHFGFRVGVRQLFYLAPDFYQNYLTTGKHTSTFEPNFGFFIHF